MSIYSETQLNSSIKAGTFSRVYLIYGEESYLKEHYLKTLCEKIVSKDFESFNLHKYDCDFGKKKDYSIIASALESCDTMPVMSEYVCAVVKDYPLESLSKEDLPLFEKSIKEIPESGICIFYMEHLEVSVRTNPKWANIISLISKTGVCCELTKRSISSTVSLIKGGAKNRGSSIGDEAAEYLVTYCGDNLQVILNELDKLCAYSKNETITIETIQNISTKSVEASVFDLAKNIISKNADKAYFILNTLLIQKTEPTIILGTLSMTYTDIFRAYIMNTEKRRISEISSLFNYNGKSFRIETAQKLAGLLSEEQIIRSIDFLSEADLSVKFSNKPNRLVLEELLAKLISI